MENKILTEKTQLAATLKNKMDELDIESKRLSGQYSTVSSEIINILEAMEIDSVKMHGFNFYVEEKASVKTPKELEDKKQFFDYLREIGIFDEMITVNSNSLNALYKSLAAEAAEKGNFDFQLPGIEKPTPYKNLRLRRI